MKKTLLLLGVAVLSFSVQSQVFTEDFEGSTTPAMPAGWTLINNDGLPVHANVAQFTDAWITASDFDNTTDTVAMSTSWYDPAGTSDDWMITPQINLTTNNVLSWEEEAQDANYPDGYEVRISTTTPTIAGFNANAPLFTIAAGSPAVWASRSVDLQAAGYSNQAVYIAWRNNSNDQFVLMIDDVLIDPPAAATYDVAMTDTTNEYTIVPLSQVTPLGASGEITEIGGQAVTNATMNVTVYDGTMTSVYTASSTPTGIGAGGSITATVAGYTPTVADVYTVELIASITESDVDATNDTTTYTVAVDDGWYARDNGNIVISLGVGAGTPAILGNNFDVNVAETMDSVMAVFAGINLLPGDTTQFEIYSTAASVPTTMVGMSAEYIITAADTVGGLIVLQLPVTDLSAGALALTPGEYYVGVKEYNTVDNYGLAFTDEIFTFGSTYGSIAGGAYGTLESFGFPNTALVRSHFASCAATSSTVTESACNTYTWALDGNTYTTSGQYSYLVGPNACGADSTVILDLTINTDDAVTDNVSECASYTWSANGQTYTTSGQYTATLTNIYGCDSVVTLDLTIGALDNTTSTAGATITSNQAGATYQWIDCGNGNAPIAGETNQSYTATANGDYAVIITSGTCVDTSACVAITGIGLYEHELANNVSVYPNPNNGQFNVSIAGIAADQVTVVLTDASGKVIYAETVNTLSEEVNVPVEVKGLRAGVYFVKVATADQQTTQRVIVTRD